MCIRDSLGADNAILSATDISTGTIDLADQIWFNDVGTGATANTLKYAPISKLKDIINTYTWKLDVNGGTPVTIADTNQVGFNNGAGIVQTLSTKDVTTAIRYVNATSPATEKNAIEAVATEAAATGDFLWFSDISPTNNVIKKATIADVVSLGDQNLTQVLAKGDNSGGANDINMTGTISNITLVDSGTAASPVTTQGRIQFGTGADLEIYHDGSSSYIANSNTTLPLQVLSDSFRVNSHTGLELSLIHI